MPPAFGIEEDDDHAQLMAGESGTTRSRRRHTRRHNMLSTIQACTRELGWPLITAAVLGLVLAFALGYWAGIAVEKPHATKVIRLTSRYGGDVGAADRADGIDEDVSDLVKQLTLEQKIGQMTQLAISMLWSTDNDSDIAGHFDTEKARKFIGSPYFVGSILNSPSAGGARLPMTASEWRKVVTDLQAVALGVGAKIPVVYGIDSVHGANYILDATLFPQQINCAATFNRSSVQLQGQVTAKDTAAAGIKWNFAPILDIATQPTWPRFYETFGEDPYVAAQMGRAIVTGMQGESMADGASVAACAKHFVGYSNSLAGHDRGPAWIPEQHLMQYYVPPFAEAIDAGVATAMSSYNEIGGEPVSSSRQYLKELLRDALGFKGMLVTDWAEIENLNKWHKVAATQQEAVRIAMEDTSIDMSMVPLDVTFCKFMLDLVKNKTIGLDRLDTSVARVLQLKKTLGLFDNPVPKLSNEVLLSVGSAVDRASALDIATQSIVLARNNNILPLHKDRIDRILVVGPTADSITNQTGGWTFAWQGSKSEQMFRYGTTVLKGIRKQAGEAIAVEYKPGCDMNGVARDEDTQDTVNAAADADVVILCLGEKSYAEKPGDTSTLDLPEGQRALAKRLGDTGTPVVVVLIQGRPRLLHGSIDSAEAVIIAGLPGPDGGQAVADVLFGTANPSGRLPYTYPKNAGDMPMTYYHKPSQKCIDADVPFVYIDCQPEFAFGTGYSYSAFSYSSLKLSTKSITRSGSLTVTVSVTNRGPYVGQHAVLLFLRQEYRRITPETKRLRGFDKFSFAVGESRDVNFTLGTRDFHYWSADGQWTVDAGVYEVQIADLLASFQITA
eukprot:jgi/Chlat1/7468/Chrsp6S07475